jgi:2-oxoglutarate dehydrogenase E2 component (dihydrolipoamide succinyltransferase)
VAEQKKINPADVSGTGRRGAVTKEDLVNYMRAGGNSAGGARAGRARADDPHARRIAERLMQSKNSIAMLTSFNEVNLGKVMAMRKELGEQFEKPRHQARLHELLRQGCRQRAASATRSSMPRSMATT